MGVHPAAIVAEQWLRHEGGRFAVAPGDVLVIYTDGLTEAVLPDGSRTDVEPLLAQLPALLSFPAVEIAEAIEMHLVETADVRDDLTVVVIKKV